MSETAPHWNTYVDVDVRDDTHKVEYTCVTLCCTQTRVNVHELPSPCKAILKPLQGWWCVGRFQFAHQLPNVLF